MLLRIHSEEHWLTYHLLPVLRELERPATIPEEQLGAALAYLELLWLDACARAAATDLACAAFTGRAAAEDRMLYEKTRRYHAAVRRLRAALRTRVEARTWPLPPPGARHA